MNYTNKDFTFANVDHNLQFGILKLNLHYLSTTKKKKNLDSYTSHTKGGT